MVSISYALTTHNEGEYIRVLLNKLLKYVDSTDELIILDDYSDDPVTLQILEEYKDKMIVHKRKFDMDFAEHKNYLLSLCTKEYIVFLDGDECPHDYLLQVIKETLYLNPATDLYGIPRINIVNGLTPEHIQKWGWKLNEKNFVNFPDIQWRICKRKEEIQWQGKVHERLIGSDKHAIFPYESEGEIFEGYCLLHLKDIKRQEKQNELYSTIH